jgi:hypothetical protein
LIDHKDNLQHTHPQSKFEQTQVELVHVRRTDGTPRWQWRRACPLIVVRCQNVQGQNGDRVMMMMVQFGRFVTFRKMDPISGVSDLSRVSQDQAWTRLHGNWDAHARLIPNLQGILSSTTKRIAQLLIRKEHDYHPTNHGLLSFRSDKSSVQRLHVDDVFSAIGKTAFQHDSLS